MSSPAPVNGDRAARNATCCEHAAHDHDLWGCAVDVSTHSRTYERCHGLVPICGAESLWSGVVCQKPPHDGDSHEANHPRPGRRGGIVTSLWSTAAVEADKRGECPGCLRRICVCPCQCDMCAARKAGR
jgi:hypothetical protein